MKLYFPLALSLLFAAAVFAQEDHPEDRTILRNLKDTYEKAVNEANAELIAPYIADDFSGVVATNVQVSGLTGLKDYWKQIQDLLGPGGKVKTSVSFEPSLISGDFAVSHGTSDNTATTSAGQTYHYTTYWTALSRKTGNDWKLVRIHDSIDPINNEFVNSFSQLRAVKYAAISGVAALIAGVVIGRITKRTKPA